MIYNIIRYEMSASPIAAPRFAGFSHGNSQPVRIIFAIAHGRIPLQCWR